MSMTFLSWNVNGIRSIVTKDKNGKKYGGQIRNNSLFKLIEEYHPDILALQEVKCNPTYDIEKNIDIKSLGYPYFYHNCAEKKGYSGTVVWSREKPVNVFYDFDTLFDDPEFRNEGRLITVEFPEFYLVNVYTPNSKPDLSRLDWRTQSWDAKYRSWIHNLQTRKKVICSGDYNVAHQEIDLKNPKSNKNSHGFTKQERDSFTQLINDCKLIDTFRELHPDEASYTWFSNFARSRERLIGWRIDYWLISENLKNNVEKSEMLSNFYGSDHLPILLKIKL